METTGALGAPSLAQPSPTATAKALPPPLVTFGQHPLRWLYQKLMLLVAALVFAYLGMHVVAGIYYLLFQTTGTMNNWWHGFIPDNDLRHAVRDIGKGLLGGLAGVYIVRNRYKKTKPLNRLDRLEIRLGIANVKDDKRLSIWQLLATPFLVVMYGSVGFFAAYGIVTLARHNLFHMEPVFQFVTAQLQSVAPASTQSVLERMETSLVSAWPNKLMGLAAAFFMGRRPAKGVFDDLQLWLCEQRILRDRQPHSGKTWHSRFSPRTAESGAPWHYPPTWKATFNELKATDTIESANHGTWPVITIKVILAVATLLAIFGWYVLTFIAA